MRDLPGIAPCSICSLLENPSSTVDNGCHQLDNRYLFIGSCNGLVCLINLVARGEFSEYRVWFCNLATRIMSEDSPHLCLRSCNYKLWWYQVKCGFAYDDRSDTYKVVLVLSNIKSQNWEVRVHRLGDTHWRKVLTCPAFPILGEKCGQPVSGTVNWFAIRKLGFDYEWETVTVDQLVIFSYDLNKETFKYLLMPNGLSQVPCGPELGVLKGCLCLSHVHRRTHFVVWLMREFGVENSWTQLLNVTLELLQAPLPCVILKPLCISEKDCVDILGCSLLCWMVLLAIANCVYALVLAALSFPGSYFVLISFKSS
ncbi:F-box/kelch-repeat protein At3g23880-like [Glycine soja]|nr:F-box/kelch-repeat protein At3g23880-like [Glycine soja]XP_040868803.1 F-box/kelch-repeat protein At3g23880 [Glycine max]